MTLHTFGAGGLVGALASAVLLGTAASASPATGPIAPASRVQGPVAPTPASSAGDDTAALALLRRAADAPQTTPYTGLQFVATWAPGATTTYLVEIDHQPGRGTAVRIDDTTARTGGVSFTTGQSSQSGGAEALAETKQRALGPAGSTILDVLADNYDLAVGGHGRVAGRTVSEVAVSRPNGGVAARFWIDSQTGVLLRREIYDAAGRTIRASAFIDVRIGMPLPEGEMPPALPAAWGDKIPDPELAAMRAEGWSCPLHLVPGMTLYDARREDGPTGPIVHLSYSDGLSTVSVFEQPGRLADDGLDGFRAQTIAGAAVQVNGQYPQRLVWSAGGKVFTIIADAPEQTVASVVAALPHEDTGDGVWKRVGRGFARVGSWLNPFS